MEDCEFYGEDSDWFSRDDVYYFTRTNEHRTPDRTERIQKSSNGPPNDIF